MDWIRGPSLNDQPQRENQVHIAANSWDYAESPFCITLGMPGHTQLKWLNIFGVSRDAWHHTKIEVHNLTSLWDIAI